MFHQDKNINESKAIAKTVKNLKPIFDNKQNKQAKIKKGWILETVELLWYEYPACVDAD